MKAILRTACMVTWLLCERRGFGRGRDEKACEMAGEERKGS